LDGDGTRFKSADDWSIVPASAA